MTGKNIQHDSRVFLSWGMGVESTAILTRWLFELAQEAREEFYVQAPATLASRARYGIP